MRRGLGALTVRGYNGDIVGHQWDVNGMILAPRWMASSASSVVSWNCNE